MYSVIDCNSVINLLYNVMLRFVIGSTSIGIVPKPFEDLFYHFYLFCLNSTATQDSAGYLFRANGQFYVLVFCIKKYF